MVVIFNDEMQSDAVSVQVCESGEKKCITIRYANTAENIAKLYTLVDKIQKVVVSNNGEEDVFTDAYTTEGLAVKVIRPSEELEIQEPTRMIEMVLLGTTKQQREIGVMRDALLKRGVDLDKLLEGV